MAIEWHQQCGKNRYRSQSEAIRNAMAANLKTGHPLRVYACPRCHGWHLTSQPMRTTPRKAAKKAPKQRSQPAARNSLGHRVECVCFQCAWLDEVNE